ncbi:MAG: DNA mismatch repair protein MutS [Opitutaceae bacterium]
MAKSDKLTPMMQQYWEVKNGLPPNTVLLFRLGDFYEMFHSDAEQGAKVLGITLTRRNDYPMAGIPYHAAEAYVGKLLAAGLKVAIVDQLEAPQPGKLVKRSLTRILSPGTTLEANQLQAHRNQYLVALDWNKAGLHAAWLDLSTGEFQLATDSDPESLLPVLTALAPAEIVLAEGALEEWRAHPHEHTPHRALAGFCDGRTISEIPGHHFEIPPGARLVMETLGVLNLEGFGLDTRHPALGAAGALVHYATENLCAKPENLRSIREYRSSATLLVDPATMRNLEIFQSARGTRDGSLLAAMDATVTAAGARQLEQFLISPQLDRAELERRQACVGAFAASPVSASQLHEELRRVRDVARILGRLQNRLRNPRELGGVRDTLEQLPALVAGLAAFDAPEVAGLAARIEDLPALRDLLRRALREELPAKLEDGGFIQTGFDTELDRLLSLTRDNQHWLSDLERSEQERTGIRSLKVRFNNAFGYFIEVTKSNLQLVPENYIRKQTMVNGERFITEDLRQKEKEIFHAEENAKAREQQLFADLVAAMLDSADALRRTALALAELDVFLGWAAAARDWDYCRPELDESDALEITEGRHPVVEQMMKKDALGLAGTHSFVPNDTLVAATGPQVLLITGPNMAGKSTYIRQVALITLMAQVGAWVPAKSCRLGLVDRIFSRVGASDDLARGNSTFMVEMNETANILNNATDRSLIILDEIGRGTSTYDGLSIAWAVVEHLHRDSARGPRTLFATHYQELTQLDKHLARLKNLSVAVKEWNDEIVFVRRVVEGAADRSYGIQVAKLAGLPREVIGRATEILGKLESDEAVVTVSALAPKPRPKRTIQVAPAEDAQLNLF